MAIREQTPRLQQREQHQSPEASIASHVSYVVDNLKRDKQTITNPHERRRRADMAMVAMLEVVAPVLPEIVKEQVNRLVSIHNELYQSAKPSTQPPAREHEH